MNGVSEFVSGIVNYFRNIILNAVGAERTFLEYLDAKDVNKAINMMMDNSTDVDNAIDEYYPQKHKIMQRPDKSLKKKLLPAPKLARARQRYINEIEVFFLLGQNIIWSKGKDGDDEAFQAFKDFLKTYRFDSTMRQVKRIAGAETESAKVYHVYQEKEGDKDVAKVNAFVVSRSTGYQIRTLFDQYKNMIAFAYGYKLREGGKTIQHWDIQTKDALYFCKKANVGWKVEYNKNVIGKITALYYKQPKAWEGVEPLLEREEELMSKVADANNYYSDPALVASADAVESLIDEKKGGIAKIIQTKGQGSDVHYLNPPQSSETRRDEMAFLSDSILFDSMTPDFHLESLKGIFGASGDAIENAMALGFIKRANRMEIYGEMVDREKNVIIEICKLLHPEIDAKKFDELGVTFEFAYPFAKDKMKDWQPIEQLYASGLVSLEKAVEMLSVADAPQEEIDRIKMAQMEKLMAEQEIATEKAQEQAPESEPQPQPTPTKEEE